MELRQLEIYCALAEERHFGPTAARLHIAQSSVSQQLQRLEREIWVRLVRRTTRRVELTAAGTMFEEEARAVLTRLERATQQVRPLVGEHEGTLYVGTNFPAGRLYLTPLLSYLREARPGLTVAVRELGSTEQELAVVDGELDLGLYYGPPTTDQVASSKRGEVDMVALVRPGHPLVEQGVLDLREARPYPFIVASKGSHTLLSDRIREAAGAVGA